MFFFKPFKILKRWLFRYKKLVIIFLVLWFLWSFGLGVLGGWLLFKGTLFRFPEIEATDKILVLAPHIDDEAIAAGGLIQEAKSQGAEVLVVYITNGDDNLSAVAKNNKRFDPAFFIVLGERRMEEGKKAAAYLGLGEDELIFLGYPDDGLLAMLGKNFNTASPLVSRGTRLNYNPYKNTYKEKQLYSGSNLSENLTEILNDFLPTIIIAPHFRDKHSDHRALYQFLERVLSENKSGAKKYAYLVHYRLYPPQKKLLMRSFLYPPKKLFTAEGWYSFNLSDEQQEKKLKAVDQNASQLKNSPFGDFLHSFVKRNEIFEEFE